MTVRRALVVDDDDLVVDILASLMDALGFEVEHTTSPERAIEMLEANPADLLVSDVKMPRMDGTELAMRAKERHPRLCILLVSGYSEHQVHRAEDLGYRVLEKPFSLERLRAAIEEAMKIS